MLALAAPLALAEIGWMSMGLVDTMMVGRLRQSAEAIGAVSLGGILFYTVALFGSGLLLGLDTMVPQAFGAGNVEECHRSLIQGLYFSILLAPALMGVVWLWAPFLRSFGIEPGVLRQAIPYLKAINWSTFPLLLYFSFRRYLQGMNLVKPVMFALVSANVINAAANWILVYGHLGAPAMGVEGSGWSTCFARIYMAAVLLGAILYYDRRDQIGFRRTPLKVDFARIRRLVSLGLPAALQLTLELGVFAAATALIGRLDPASLAGHQIALNVAGLTFMVPLGISSAAAVRVGHAVGRRDARGAGHAGWVALALAASFMSCTAAAFLLFPRYIVRIFTPNATVIRTGVMLLVVAAFFQLFDGVQVVATGALRGAGDTRTPMLANLLAYWLVGLPLGTYLCFRMRWGAVGMWIGLCLALILVGSTLLLAWQRKVRLLSGSLAGS
jgi:MATE family, multidrug efflux pump